MDAEVIIIGAGVSGAGSAYHLANAGCKDVLVLESGKVGLGYEGGSGVGEEAEPRYSGTAVMAPPANTIKMVIQLYACSSAEYVRLNGKEGAQAYLRLASIGIQHIKAIAPKVLPNPHSQIKMLGSLYVADEAGVQGLEEEFRLLKELGCERAEMWGKEKVEEIHGEKAGFVRGIFFPDDAIIDSTAYAKGLIRHALSTGAVRIRDMCPRVVSVESDSERAVVKLEDGTTLYARQALVCTGGLFLEASLCGVINPSWSYLTSLKVPKEACELKEQEEGYSMNFFTWGFTHDWCITNGHVRVSGEDHYSGLKSAHSSERNQRMAEWCAEKYPSLARSVEGGYAYQCGIVSETPDFAPLFGKPREDSRVAYLLGCNAWGQACMSWGASVAPGILGYRQLGEEERALLDSVSISRFTHLPAVASRHGQGGRPKL